MKIKNIAELVKSTEREIVLNILEEGISSIDTEKAIYKNIKFSQDQLIIKGKKFNLSQYERIFVIGIGKCAEDATYTLEQILGDKIYDGVVIDIKNDKKFKKIKNHKGDHPYPTEKNIIGTEKIINLLKDTTQKDLVLFIISGGGSTLLCQPKNLTCENEKNVIECLFRESATIQEINTVRKHISYARGGFLAEYAYPASVVSIIFSDVIGDDLQFIASGPTVKDKTTIDDAKKIIDLYKIEEKCGLNKENLIETPKDEKYFDKVDNILLISNKIALEAMKTKSENLGYKSIICDSCLLGEARVVGKEVISLLHKQEEKTVLLYGGETTVTVAGNGVGGRNQELILSALSDIKDDELIVSFASDGWDNSPYAGALCDIITKSKVKELNLSGETYLMNNDSYNFFKKTGDYIETGHTGSNVSDLLIAVKL